MDAKEPVPHGVRKVLQIYYNQKYWLLLIQYVKPESLPNPNPVQYEIVVDRQSGQVVYDSGPQSSYPTMTTAISGEALFDDYEDAYMRRIDLSTGRTQWVNPWSVRGTTRLLTFDDWLYVFDYDGNIRQYNQADGHLVRTASLGVAPHAPNVLL